MPKLGRPRLSVPTDPIALALIAWRESMGLSQNAAADLYGYAAHSWNNWECGRRKVPNWLKKIIEKEQNTA